MKRRPVYPVPAFRGLLIACILGCLLLAACVLLVRGASAASPPAYKGLAPMCWTVACMGDVATLNAQGVYHWYDYAEGCPPASCVNMNRSWTLPQATCYDALMVGNEPTNPWPAGYIIAPTLAASVTLGIEADCPAMRLIVANIHLNNADDPTGSVARAWITNFLSAYAAQAGHAFTHTLGLHCYAQYATTCLERIGAVMPLYDGDFWLSEFAFYGQSPYTSGAELATFLAQAPVRFPAIRAYYIWTNRSGWPFNLVNGDGTLTAMGQVYADWQPPSVRQAWLPVAAHRPAGYP